jgi:hypothetical protein
MTKVTNKRSPCRRGFKRADLLRRYILPGSGTNSSEPRPPLPSRDTPPPHAPLHGRPGRQCTLHSSTPMTSNSSPAARQGLANVAHSPLLPRSSSSSKKMA